MMIEKNIDYTKQYRFTGTHAVMVKDLIANNIFEHGYDVFLTAPLVGFAFNKKSRKNNLGDDQSSIFAEQMIRIEEERLFCYRLIMLLDEIHETDENKRLDKAFKEYNTPSLADVDLFEQYIYGGIEYLYDQIIKSADNRDEYVLRLYDFLEDFENKYKNSTEEVFKKRMLDLAKD